MKKFFLLFLLLLLSGHAFCQKGIGKINLALVAVQVANLDSSVNWYTKHLNFRLSEKKEFKEYDLRIAFLKQGSFELELVENKKTVSKAEALTKLNVPDLTGFAKLTLEVDEIGLLYSKLLKENVNIIFQLGESNREKDKLHFIITDNEGNWIQFVGDK